ncbi:MAG: TRAP transporter small permease [Pseudomonadota bacterium]
MVSHVTRPKSAGPNGAGLFAPDLQVTVGSYVTVLAHLMALLGGLVLVVITILTVASVTGRSLIFMGLGPIRGDFELVEAGTAFAVFAFLPWCQLQRGHVTVDIAVAGFGPRVMAWLAFVGNVLLTLVAGLIFWRLLLGMADKQTYSETTFILQFPVWWSYLAASVGAGLFALVCAYTAWRSANEATGLGEPAQGSGAH